MEQIDFEGRSFEEELSAREMMRRLEQSERSYGYIEVPVF